jgi:hypothetical protein
MVSIQQATNDQQMREADDLRTELASLKTRNGIVEQAAVGEFRRNRRQIEARLNVLQEECAQLAGMLTAKNGTPQQQAAAASTSVIGTSSMPATPSRQSSIMSPILSRGVSSLTRSTPSPWRPGGAAQNARTSSPSPSPSPTSALSSSLPIAGARPSSAPRYASPDRARSIIPISVDQPNNTSNGTGGIDDWSIPANIAAVTDDFRFKLAKSDGSMGSGTIASYLVTLNKLWMQRLAERLRQVRNQHAREMRDERRQWAHTIPYEQVIGRATNARLRKSLEQQRAGMGLSLLHCHVTCVDCIWYDG